jgi:hypothetical protein
MTARHLATDEPWLEDAVLLFAIVGSVLELALSIRLIWELFAGG